MVSHIFLLIIPEETTDVPNIVCVVDPDDQHCYIPQTAFQVSGSQATQTEISLRYYCRSDLCYMLTNYFLFVHQVSLLVLRLCHYLWRYQALCVRCVASQWRLTVFDHCTPLHYVLLICVILVWTVQY